MIGTGNPCWANTCKVPETQECSSLVGGCALCCISSRTGNGRTPGPYLFRTLSQSLRPVAKHAGMRDGSCVHLGPSAKRPALRCGVQMASLVVLFGNTWIRVDLAATHLCHGGATAPDSSFPAPYRAGRQPHRWMPTLFTGTCRYTAWQPYVHPLLPCVGATEW